MTRRSLLLAALCIPAALPAQDIAGDWKATLKAGAAEFRLALHIAKADTGFNATLDSLDQGVNGIPVSGISFQESKLKLKVDAVAGSYEGALSADGASIQGTWTQGQPLPLTFTRVKDAAELNRFSRLMASGMPSGPAASVLALRTKAGSRRASQAALIFSTIRLRSTTRFGAGCPRT